MQKALTYSTFILATIVVVFLFVTSKNYTQLAIAVVLYPGIACLALNVFPRRTQKDHEVTIKLPVKATQKEEPKETIKIEQSGTVIDTNKRDFLKLVGAAGISVFLFSLLGKKTSIPFLGKSGGSDSLSLTDSKGKTIDPAQAQALDGYQICEIDDNLISYYGFIKKDGSWYIMREDTETSSFRYARGDANFPGSWDSRTRLKYDYLYNV